MKKKLLIFLIAASLAAGQGTVSAYATDTSDTETLDTIGSVNDSTDTASDMGGGTTFQDTAVPADSSQDTSDADMQLALDENNQATFQTTMKSGVNRFEILYTSSDKTPVVEFSVNGNVYEAAYGGQVSDDNPMTILKGKTVTVDKKSNSQYSATMNLMAVYFDTDKISLADGTAVDVTVNLPDDRTAFIIARTEVPFLWNNIADGEETREKLLATDDPYFLLKYSLANQNIITSDDIVPVITENDNETNTPETAEQPKPNKTAARIKLILVCAAMGMAVAAFFMMRTKKADKAAAEKRNEKKKAKRKQKEQEVRDRDRLSSALKEFEDEYTDDGYSEASEKDIRNFYENEADTDMNTAESEGMSQIPQSAFPEYSSGIKEALFTIGPEEEERLKRKREELIKERDESIREAESGEIKEKPEEKRVITEHKTEEASKESRKEADAAARAKTVKSNRKPVKAAKTPEQKKKPRTVKPAKESAKPVKKKPGSVKINLNAISTASVASSVSTAPASSASIKPVKKAAVHKPSASKGAAMKNTVHKPSNKTSNGTHHKPVTKAPVSRNRMQTKGTLPGKNARIGGAVKVKPLKQQKKITL